MSCHYHSTRNAMGVCRLCATDLCEECMNIINNNVLCEKCIRLIGEHAEKRYGTGLHTGEGTATVGSASFAGNPFADTTTRPSKHQQANHATTQPALQPKRKSKFITFLFCFVPGLAHMYLGFIRQGLEMMALFFMTIWLTARFDGMPFAFLIPITFFFSVFHVFQKREQLERGEVSSMDQSLFRNLNS
ncbi:hypothetical protein [Brevibacillus dissolubilis]|uniref:hypothetical protein n=1 Tax=Brevibacillus dissolubilis TaxID=1844116 RepID=UPI001117A02B|nr:hypothetical protein [Brevibacillus dissolubilis]